MGWWFGAGAALLALVCVFIARIFLVLRRNETQEPRKRGSASILVVVGSGGHTSEILRLVGSLSASYAPRHYVIAETDRMSEDKVRTLEAARTEGGSEPQYTIHRIPRSREVRQSWASSVVSTLYALLYSIPLVFQLKPDMVLCNGPGTCVPPCISALLLRILGMKKVLIIYIESICRVETLSLSGKILYSLSDYFFVQWPTLKKKYPKAVFLGRLV
ncbi:UDP-N-acetylglucosamine transferase subunit ALG14 homolog isoform X1 [Pristis pectinata]|uniref:UDP-N-acetylglucosamine transferase subunit ALG14 homolog isoform X1 n=1 Tax=Pristis pectinata TaxID=685728 RepID=UPI00223CADA7|nr:UDP-N-acetylglucosamine transferase subunit ALG14 homolog isoform X1 [Pristis pectinata]